MARLAGYDFGSFCDFYCFQKKKLAKGIILWYNNRAV